MPSVTKLLQENELGYRLLVMGPHAKDLDDAFVADDLIDQAVLNINAAGICAAQIPEEFFKRRRFPKRIDGEDGEKFFDLPPQTCGIETAGIFLGLLSEDDLPRRHQPGSFSH